MSLYIVRLVTGEDLIGELNIIENPNPERKKYKLTNVGIVQLVPTKEGVGISLYPYAPYAEESEFTFKEEHVITTFKPSLDLENNYSRMFGSGIQIASSIR
jgi:hypothetical protein